MTRGLLERGLIAIAPARRFELTPAGLSGFERIGLDLKGLPPGRHGLARPCLDWSEREYHLAGPLGAQGTNLLCANGWLRRSKTSRAMQATPTGWAGLREQLGVEQEQCMLSCEP